MTKEIFPTLQEEGNFIFANAAKLPFFLDIVDKVKIKVI